MKKSLNGTMTLTQGHITALRGAYIEKTKKLNIDDETLVSNYLKEESKKIKQILSSLAGKELFILEKNKGFLNDTNKNLKAILNEMEYFSPHLVLELDDPFAIIFSGVAEYVIAIWQDGIHSSVKRATIERFLKEPGLLNFGTPGRKLLITSSFKKFSEEVNI